LSPKVLVLDDDENIRTAFAGFFEKEKCTMTATSSPEEAMQLLEDQHFDLLITDIRLKSSSGVTMFLNARVNNPRLPVIVITGYPESVDETTLKAIGVDYFFIKPLEVDKLRQAVRACLHKGHPLSPSIPLSSINTRKEQQ
jgi:DNA-binding response OmpR family regulator